MSDLSKENEQEINELVFDENDDGFLDNVISFDRNSLGKITKVVLDFEWDDVPDMAIYFEYDNKGRIQRKLIDKI